ncbi:MAG: LacI family transcriptional regulator [Synergistaceae bacterium]|jgi:LacI family transcriptional regulator|nr:LacI family transcriptional regulator [Synergistaceae bacterium]
MAATIHDIAKRSKVSLATVSRVINNAPHVSEKLKQKVETAIKELNYIPSAYARVLSKNQSNIIGVMIPEITNPFFGEIITGITEVADAEGFNVLLVNTDENVEKEARSIRILREYRIRGLISTPVTGDNKYDRQYVNLFENMNIPIVLMDRGIKNGDFDGIYFDDETALFKITSTLIENGHSDIVMLIGIPHHIVSQRRVRGYGDAFEANNLSYDKKNLIPCEFSIDSAYSVIKKLIQDNDLPTAIIGMTNMLSMGCLKALYEYGVSIPRNISFAGYDRLEIHDVLNMNLTLAEKDAVEMGRKAAALMIDKLSGKSVPNKTILMPELFIRGSEKFPEKTLP